MKALLISIAAAIGTAKAECGTEPLVVEAKSAASRALSYMRSISTEGGWVWRYSLDLNARWGEREATRSMIWVQAPGTPAVGMALLRAYQATGDPDFLDASKNAADALAAGQLQSGGWDYSIDFDPEESRRVFRRGDRARIPAAEAGGRFNLSTYDDDNTQNALVFLMAVAELSQDADEPRDQRIRGARDYGLAKMLEAQYPNGAWPQRYDGVPKLEKDFPVLSAKIPNEWPREWPRTDYKWHYTLNDNTLADCIAVMLEAHRRYGMAEHLAAAKRAGDFLLLAQLPEPQAAWAQQYDTRMHPAWARAFEPPAVTASESAGAVRTLIDLFIETGEGKFLDAVPRVIAWWGLVQIAPSRWARFYELGSNRPIYGDRDGRIHYRLDEISEERRSGYAWEGEFGVSSAIRAYEEVLTEGREVLLKKRERGTLSDQDKTARARELESRVREVIEALDPEGRWVTKGTLSAKDPREESSDYVETRMFIRNLGVLSDYLEVARGE